MPELPADPADYVQFLSELNLFETTSFSDEDRRRADDYRDNVRRDELRAGFSDITAYLQSLDMRIAMRPFDAFALPRIAQLIQRTNQFSLTAERQSLPQCEAMMRADSGYLPFYVTLADKFGDNGLISVIILKDDGEALDVVTWRMSCRVLGRGVEAFAMNRVVELARDRGREWVTGTYVPTGKNGMVREFFAQFGFEQAGTRDDGGTAWRLRVASYQPRAVCMTETA